MKQYDIYVFSGTGNTEKCAAFLQKELSALGAAAELHHVESGEETSQGNRLILCYPIHGFNAPNPMLRFCRGIPDGHGDVWFLKTSGEPLHLNDNSSAELVHILRRKGYDVKGEFHYVMPYNMVFRHSDEMASLMWKTAKQRIPAAARQILSDEGACTEAPLSARLMSGICRIEHGFYPLNGRLFRVDGKRCIRCMQCVNSCPTQNIRYENGRFRFGGSCTGCTRCSFNCPGAAIHIGLLDFIRVNGRYDFDRDPKKATIGRYCRKAYLRYYLENPDNTYDDHSADADNQTSRKNDDHGF